MPEEITAEKIFNSILDTIGDSVPKQKSVSFFEEDKSNSVSSQLNRLFGRQNPVHKVLGGGKCKFLFIYLFPYHLVIFLLPDSCPFP